MSVHQCNVVGETTGDAHFAFVQGDGVKPFDLDVAQMFGHSPKTIMKDETVERKYENVSYSINKVGGIPPACASVGSCGM